MEKQRRALILYATMTKNTEKIAVWFQETFQAYQWDVTMLRLKNNMNIDEIQPQVYFDDYDVICLGSPIVAGYPLKIVSKLFSLGAHSGLEEETRANVESGAKEFSMPPTGGGPAPEKEMPKELKWRRSGERGPYPGAIYQSQYQPLGIVFTTYGGGFYGSDECTATLEILKMFLQLFGDTLSQLIFMQADSWQFLNLLGIHVLIADAVDRDRDMQNQIDQGIVIDEIMIFIEGLKHGILNEFDINVGESVLNCLQV